MVLRIVRRDLKNTAVRGIVSAIGKGDIGMILLLHIIAIIIIIITL